MYRILRMLTTAGFIKVTLELTSLHDGGSAKAIRSSVKAIVREVMQKASRGQMLWTAIEDVDTGYGSPVMRLQKYAVAASHCPRSMNEGPEGCRNIGEEEYAELVRNGDDSTVVMPFYKVGDDIRGIMIEYKLHYDAVYYGRCFIEVPRFVRMSRRDRKCIIRNS